jgi:hypothetical protein
MDDPFLRPAPPEGAPSAPCPPGCAAEPAGLWHGRQMEVVYDPRRHDVLFLRGRQTELEPRLGDIGWQHARTDGSNQMWVRDRAAVAGQALDRAAADAPGRTLAR